MSDQMWFVTPLVLLLLYVLRTSGRNQTAVKRGDSLVFGPSRSVILTVVGGLALGGGMIVGPVLQTGRIDPATAVLGAVAIVSGAFLMPPSISLSGECIEARWWWGKRVAFQWSSAEAAFYDRVKNEMLVYGSNGRVVTHTQYHVDGSRFMGEIARRVNRIDGLKD